MNAFRQVGWRLALLNASVVIVVIALTGATTYFLLRHSLDDEVDSGLHDRIEQVRDAPERWGIVTDDDDDDHDHDIIDSGDTLVFVVDARGNLLSNNRGVVLDELPVDAAIKRALDGDRDTRNMRIDGVRMRVMTVPIREHGDVIGAVQAARSLREHEAELSLMKWMTLAGIGIGAVVAIPAGLLLARRAMRPIDAAFKRQRAFVADASHELRTPLTLVRANTELVLLDPERPVAEVQPSLQNILVEVDRTDSLIDDLLLLARSDASRLDLVLMPEDPGIVAAEAADVMRPLFDAGGIRLRVTRGDIRPMPVDRARLLQVFRIVLDNALRHTPTGGEVAIQATQSGRSAMITVSDTGPGIDPQHLAHVFERFYRVDSARSRQAGGSGLGLPIAKAIVEAHGGRISIESQPDQGTTVTIVLGTPGKTDQ